jgi:Cu2+-containing amine oxidase
MSSHTLFAIVLLLTVGVGPACAERDVTTALQRTPQPLDPLTREERQLAEKLVRADPRSKELLGAQAALASLEFLAMKVGDKDEAVRHADLLFSRPDAEFGARAIVRLGSNPAVVELTRVDRRSVPVVTAEIQEAWKIALADAAYTRRLAREPSKLTVEALRLYTEDRSDPCFSGRCLYVMVREGAYYISNASVVVDLSAKRILPERSPK